MHLKFKDNKTVIMGVLNVTPDSFSDGGQFFTIDYALARARQLVAEGADIVDIGGESTRPGSNAVDEDEELNRVAPVIEQLAREITVPISIDTYKPAVANACLERGAGMINDISGLRYDNGKMLEVAATHQVPVCIVHMQGLPKTMQQEPQYDDLVAEIKGFFSERIKVAKSAGIKDENIILDPGIGFGKTVEHNLILLQRLNEFSDLGFPLLIGTSRKSFIGKISDLPAEERLEGTIASNVLAVMMGAKIVRVHDVLEHIEFILRARCVNLTKKRGKVLF